MKVSRLITKNFRNLESNSLDFSDGINIIYGNNAQGKTNIIEAIYLIGTTKSFKKVDEDQYICFDKELAKIKANIEKQKINKEVEYLFEIKRNKRIFLNGKQVHKFSDYLGNLNVTLFCPDDLMLIKGDATFRRRFMDILFCQTDKTYLDDLMHFQRSLKQRNNALKEIKEKQSNLSILEPWDIQTAHYASKIVAKRAKNINNLNKIAYIKHKSLNKDENLDIKYIESTCSGYEMDAADYEKAFIDKQKTVQGEELRRGSTIIGPHRDDLEISINGINTRFFGSQGQKRSIAISLRMAEVDFIHDIADEFPVLLLDDIFSELDDDRKKNLMGQLDSRMQIFITGTELNQFTPIKTKGKIFSILKGKVCEENAKE